MKGCLVVVSVVLLLTLTHVVTTAALNVSIGDPARPANFWDDAVVIDLPSGGDLGALLYSLEGSPQSNFHVITLAEGEYLMPRKNYALFNVTSGLQFVGKGVNVTYIHMRGYQASFMIHPGATIEYSTLTLTGASGACWYFAAVSDAGGNTPAFPTLYFEHMEMWAPGDDTDVNALTHLNQPDCPPSLNPSNSSAGCDVNQIVAFQLKFLKLGQLTYAWGDPNDIIYSPTYVEYPASKGYFVRIFEGLTTDSQMTINVCFDVIIRVVAYRPDMQELFDYFKEESPDLAGQTDCFNPDDHDLGFSYRGTKAVADTGAPCMRWDDPKIYFNHFQPNLPGKFTSNEANYCRNNKYLSLPKPGPWCLVNVAGKPSIESCGIPACVPKRRGSGSFSSGAIAGIVIAILAIVSLLAVIGLLLLRRRARSKYSGKALEGATPLSQQPWHVQTLFESIEEHPPPGRFPATSPPAAAESGPPSPHAFPPDTVTHILTPGIPIDSLSPDHLQHKFGEVWCKENAIDASRLIGSGAFGHVYPGTHRGAPAAYKVMNQMKTCERMLRFVRKNVLPVALVQREPHFPMDHPHLLPLIDCLMYPPWYVLLEVARDLGISSAPATPAKLNQAQEARVRKHVQELNRRHRAMDPPPKPDADASDSEENPFVIFDAGDSLGSALLPSLMPQAASDASSSGGRFPTATSSGNMGVQVAVPCSGAQGTLARHRLFSILEVLQPDAGPHGTTHSGVAEQPPLGPGDSDDATAEPSPGSLPSAHHGVNPAAESLPSAPDGRVQEGVREEEVVPADSSEVVPALWFNNHDAALPAARSPAAALSGTKSKAETKSSRTDSAGSSKKCAVNQTASIVSQVIMVMPLCELGTLNAFIQNKTSVPMSCLPKRLREQMAGHLSIEMRSSIDEDAPQLTTNENNTFSLLDLPEQWQALLKLQLCLQIVDGVMALHSCRLVHCDIKPENIFLTASAAFQPFGICVKIGDMDTCRSLRGAHSTSEHNHIPDAPPLQKAASTAPEQVVAAAADDALDTERSVSRSVQSSVNNKSSCSSTSANSVFTTCLKGTPGFLAPEMILHGKVAPTTDVFSVAVTVAIILSRRHRFIHYDDLHIRSIPDFPESVGQDLVQALQDAVLPDPRDRPSLSTLNAILQAQFEHDLGKCLGDDGTE